MKIDWFKFFILAYIGVFIGLLIDGFFEPPTTYYLVFVIGIPFGVWFQSKFKVFERK